MCTGATASTTWTCCARVGCRSCSTGSTRPPPSGRCCASSASGTPANWSRYCASTWWRWPKRTELLAGTGRSGVHRHRLAAAPGLRARQTGRLLRPHQDRRQTGAAQGPLAAGHHDQHRALRAGDRRDAATRGQDRLGQRSRAHGRPGHRHRPGGRGHAGRSWSAATPPTATAPSSAPAVRGNADFSLVMTKNPAIARAIAAIPDTAWTPVRYPGAVQDPDTGAWISDAEVAEVTYTAFAAHQGPDHRPAGRAPGQRRPLPRRTVPGLALPPVLHQLDLPTAHADIIHRRHAIIETVFADLIDGPLAHLPSGHFGANSAWVLCAAIAHNLLHATGTLAGQPHTRARGATLRRRSSPCPPDWPDPPAHPCCTYPATGPGRRAGCGCGTTPSATPSVTARPPLPDTNPPATRPEHPDQWKGWTDQRPRHASDPGTHDQFKARITRAAVLRIEAKSKTDQEARHPRPALRQPPRHLPGTGVATRADDVGNRDRPGVSFGRSSWPAGSQAPQRPRGGRHDQTPRAGRRSRSRVSPVTPYAPASPPRATPRAPPSWPSCATAAGDRHR